LDGCRMGPKTSSGRQLSGWSEVTINASIINDHMTDEFDHVSMILAEAKLLLLST
jgi:hypothetical protein